MPQSSNNAHAVARHSHSIIVSSSAKEARGAIYKRIGDYLSNNQAVIYVAEPNPPKVIQQMSKVVAPLHEGIEIENYIDSGALTIIDRDEFYSPQKTQQLDPRKLLNSWHSLILQARKRKKNDHRHKPKGVVGIGNPSVFLDIDDEDENKDYRHNLIDYEKMLGKRYAQSIEAICWYNTAKIYPKLSFSQLIPILNSHQAVIHNGWLYRKWHPYDIVEFVHDGIDKVLGKGTSNLISQTLKLVYKLEEQELIISQPHIFEEKVERIIGEQSAGLAFGVIADAIRKEISFNRISNKAQH